MASKKFEYLGMEVELYSASFEVTSSNGKLRSGIIYFDRDKPEESAKKMIDGLVSIGKEEAKIEIRNLLGV